MTQKRGRGIRGRPAGAPGSSRVSRGTGVFPLRSGDVSWAIVEVWQE
jgi:hypothetical protein